MCTYNVGNMRCKLVRLLAGDLKFTCNNVRSAVRVGRHRGRVTGQNDTETMTKAPDRQCNERIPRAFTVFALCWSFAFRLPSRLRLLACPSPCRAYIHCYNSVVMHCRHASRCVSVGDAWLRSLAHRDTRLRHLLHLALVASSAFLLYGVLFGCTAIEKGAHRVDCLTT